MNSQQAERIAAAVNALRPEWPVSSLVTFIGANLANRPYLDVAVALTYVATEQNADGSWTSATPGRVREAGRWWNVGTTGDTAAREKAEREREERLAAIKVRNRAISLCDMCDDRGYLGAVLCDHETEHVAAARRGAARARAALAAALKLEDA